LRTPLVVGDDNARFDQDLADGHIQLRNQSTHFIVEIEGLLAGGFSQCSGLQVQIEGHEYRAGGVNDYVFRFAGRTTHPPLLLKHGLSPLDGLWNWHQDTVAGVIKRRNGTIYLLDQQRLPVMWWDFQEGLPMKWTGPELSADRGAVAFESIEIVHHGLSRPRLGGLLRYYHRAA
jgi:phage tail-like protein